MDASLTTKWLVRRFVKNPEDAQNPSVRTAYGVLASGVGIGLNLLLAFVKFALGVVSGSLAVTADAVNNLSDAFGSVVSLVSVRFAQKPVDKEHPFGHGRVEYIGSLVVGGLIVMMAVNLLRDGVGAILSPQLLRLSLPVVGLLVLSMGAKLWLYFFYRELGQKTDSAPLLAASKDSLSDVAATGAVLLSLGVQAGWHWLVDGYASILVSLFVFKAGYEVCRDTIGLLLGSKPSPQKVAALEAALLSSEGILGLHDLVLHDYGPGRCFATVHAEVSVKEELVAIHELIDRAERDIGDQMNLMLCIHMDPVVTDDPKANAVQKKLSDYLRGFDEHLSLHDFRMVPGDARINLIFDCVLPPGYGRKEDLHRSLVEYAKSLDLRYELIVHFDQEYV